MRIRRASIEETEGLEGHEDDAPGKAVTMNHIPKLPGKSFRVDEPELGTKID